MGTRLFCGLALGLWTAWASSGAQTFVAFGLTNTTIGDAAYTSNQYYGFIVENLGTNGSDGLSILLGEADSGIFVSPATDRDPVPGTFMAGRLYGSVNGQTNRLICFMHCFEQADTVHPVTIDLAGLGTSHLTCQAFRNGLKIAETGVETDLMVVHVVIDTPYYPRVNPFWRMPDGSVGALIEFSVLADLTLPDGTFVSADRVFIRADNPTNAVDFASRLDITSWLPWFQISDARLGVFRRPHRALGDAHLHARVGALNVANLGTNGADGLAVELDSAVRFDATFLPIPLETNGVLTIVTLGNVGEGPGQVLGSARVARAGGTLELQAHLDIATNTTVVVYSNGVPTGMAVGTNASVPAAATVAGCEAHAKLGEGRPGIVVRLAQTVSVTLPDQSAAPGDEIRFVGDGEFSLLETVAFHAAGLTDFTIVSETEHPLPAPRLQIVRSDGQLELSWFDPYRAFRLEGAAQLGGAFYELEQPPAYVGDRATVLLPISEESAFYRLSALSLPTQEH